MKKSLSVEFRVFVIYEYLQSFGVYFVNKYLVWNFGKYFNIIIYERKIQKYFVDNQRYI